jgi:two-component system NtrC family sensor kinase
MSESTQATLTVLASPSLSRGTRFVLGRTRCRVGRGARNEVRIDAPGVAEEHAKIELRYGRFILEVLAGGAPVTVNHEPVPQSRRLLTGDTVELAGTSFQFHLGVGERVLEPPSQPTRAEVPAVGTQVLATSRFALADLVAVVSAEDLRRDYHRIKTAFDAVSTLLNTFDLTALCERMLDAVFELVPAEHGSVLLRKDDGSLWAVRERTDGGQGPVPAVSQTVVAHVLERKEAVLAMDIGADERFAVADSILDAHVRSLMAVPLLAGDEVLGILHVVSTSRVGAFREPDLDLVSALGVGAGMVLSNNRLYRRLEEALERQVAFNQTLKHTVDERTSELRDKNRALSEAIARLQATQDQIIAQEKLASLGTLASGIAHELLNPLNFVNNFADLVVEGVEELRQRLDERAAAEQWSEVQELLTDIDEGSQAIRAHGRRAEKVVVGMRQLAKAKGGERTPTDLNDVLSNLVNALRHGQPVHGPRLVTVLDPGMQPIDAVIRDLSLALLNILHNALQAVQARMERSAEGFVPEVVVRSEDRGDRVLVVIRDNGDGIPAEIRHRVFEPFFTTKPAGQGIGLGLSLAHDVIVEGHGGSIAIDSVVGEFTALRVTLPRTPRSGR